VTALLIAAVVSTTSLLLAALGGVIAERSGVLTIGLEGYMLSGAFAAVAVSASLGRWAGLIAAIAAGSAIAGIHAVLCVTMRVNQIVAGVVLNILALGATTFFNQAIFGLSSSQTRIDGFGSWAIPLLHRIPYIGPAFFHQTLFTYISGVLLVVVVVFLRRTRRGLALRAVGEFPLASEARGISVARTRYAAVAVSGMLAGLGGAMLSLGDVGSFVANMTNGRGYIALAAVIFARWQPLGAAAACALFGLADASQVWANVLGVNLSADILSTAPYLVTVLALTLLPRRSGMPRALGVPYVREQSI
jgi:general nucleoside transport system permease protein